MKSFLAKLNGGATFLSRAKTRSTAPNGDATFLSRVTKCLTTAAISLAALLITGSAQAVNRTLSGATVVWDHDFNTGSKVGTDGVTYTLAWNGNTVAEDGALVLNGDAYGSSITYDKSSSMDGLTVIVKYSGLSALTDRTAGIAGITDSRDLVMVHSKANNSLSATAHWSGSADEFSFNSASTFGSDTGYVVISYRAGANSFIATGASLNALTGGTCGLKFGSTPPGGTILGGSLVQNGNFKVKSWPGVKIESVALFRENGSQSIAVADFANFAFPPTPVAQFIGDNMKDDGTSNGYVLSANGNTDNGNGSISLSSAHGGLLIDKDDFAMANGSVIVRYTAYTADTTKRHSFASFGSDSATPKRVDDDYGCSLNGGDSKGCFTQPGTLNWYSGSVVPMNADGSTYAVVIAPNGNKLLYHDNGSGVMTAYVNSDKEKTSPTLNKLAIGGLRGSSASDKYDDYNTFNMTIDAIAVFDRALSEAEVRAYQFPRSQPIQPGTLIRWANTGSANELSTGYKKTRMQFRIPATAELPAGSVVKVKTIRLASTAAGTASVDANANPQFLELNHIKSEKVNGNTGGAPVLSEDKKIAANATTSAYALEYSWTTECRITVGESYGRGIEDSNQGSNDGLTGLHNNGNALMSSGKSVVNVRYVHSADANNIVFDAVGSNSSSATPKIPTEAGYYPVYEITAEVISNPACETKATVNTDVQDTWTWGTLPWNVTPTKALNAEITVTGSKPLIVFPSDDTDATAKSITFKGSSSVDYKATGVYDGGKITSEIPIILHAATSIDVDAGANDLTYSYGGSEISPTLTFSGNFTKEGVGTLALSHDFAAGKTLTVAGGTLKYTPANRNGFKGTLNVLSGATYVNTRNEDVWDYNYDGIVLNIHGTFDMGSTRANVNEGQTWNIYGGATITCASNNTRCFDFADNGDPTFNFLPHVYGESDVINFDVQGSYRTQNPTFNIDNGVTVIVRKTQDLWSGTHTLTKTGLGTLKFTSTGRITNASIGFTANAGTVEVAEGASLAGSNTIAAGATLKATGACASNFTVNGALVFDGGSLTGTISGTPTSVTVQGETEAIGYLAGATFDLAANATLVMSGATEPLISGTINSVGDGAKVKLPQGFAFGTIANVGEGVTAVTVVNAAGDPVTSAKVENGKLIVPKSEIVTPYNIAEPTIVEGNLVFGEGGSINIMQSGASLTATGTITLPENGLPVFFALGKEYVNNTVIPLVTAADFLVGETVATIANFNLPTVTPPKGMAGEFQLVDNSGTKSLVYAVTKSDYYTSDVAAILEKSTIQVRFDASRVGSLIVGQDGKVTQWNDISGNNNNAVQVHYGQITDVPSFVPAGDGALREYVDFGLHDSHKDLRFSTVNGKTIFLVADIQENKDAFILGQGNDSDSFGGTYDFHRNCLYYFNGDSQVFAVRDNKVDKGNGRSELLKAGFRVISLRTDGNGRFNNFAADRNGCGTSDNRTGGKCLCELISFSEKLTDEQTAAIEDYLIAKWKLAFKNTATISGAKSWSGIVWDNGKFYADAQTEITLDDDTVLTYDAPAPVGNITFVNEGDYALEQVITANAGFASNLTIPAGETYTFKGGDTAENTFAFSNMLTVNGTLKTEGYVTLSNSGNTVSENGGLFEVVSGYALVRFADRGMKGTLTIDNDATFAPTGYPDAVKYDGNSPVVNVYGILDFTTQADNSQRWTIRNNITLNFYAGSRCIGAGQTSGNLGALQFNNANCVLNFLKKDGQGGTVDFSATIRAENAFTMNVEENVVVNMGGSLVTNFKPFTLTGAGTINLTSDYNFDAPVTIGEDATLVLDGGSCAGGYTNNGTIEVKNGNLDMGSKRDFAEFGDVTFGEQGTLSATATSAEYGVGSASFTNLPESLTTLKFIVNGVEQSLPVSEGKATYSGDVVVDGFATWLDYTFTKETREARKDSQGYILNAGSAGTDVSLKYDTNYSANNSYNEENGALLAKSTPWRKMSGTSAWPSSYTVAVCANVPDVENCCLIGFGSTTDGNTHRYVTIVRGADSNTMKLMEGNGLNNNATLITEMSALNATVSKHLIVFKNDGTKFYVYCDGVKVTEVGAIALGDGFQVGSVHGGVPGNLTRVSGISDQTVKDAVEIKAVRAWDRLITDAEMDALVAEFPYINKAGLFDRTIDAATANLSEENAWANHETQDKVALPQSKTEDEVTYQPSISVETTVESTLTLNDSLTVDTATFDGDGTLTITAGGSENALTVGGSITVNSPIKIKYGEVNISTVPLKLGASGAVEIDLADCGFSPTVVGRHQLTGVTDEAAGKITIKNQPTAQYFKGELVHEDGSYWFKVSADYEPGSTLYLTASTTLSDNTLYALTADGEAVVPRVNPEDIIYVKEGVKATLPTSALSVALGQFDGVGTIAVNGGTLKNSAPLFTLASTWTGTVEMTNIAMAGDGSNESWFSLNAYGNENSKVKLAGATGYMQHAIKFLPEVVLENTGNKAGLEITAGASNSTVIFRKISGTGNLLDNPGSGVTQRMAVGDVSGFTGQVRALLTGGITLGSAENTAGDGQIVVANGTTIAFNGQMWEAANGVSFGATMDVVGAAGNYITMPEQTTLPAITVGGQPTSLMLKYEEDKLMLAQAAASFNGVKYETLAEAITAANAATGEAATITVYTSIPAEDELEINVAEGKTITLEGVNDACVCNGTVTKTGAGTLVLNGPISYVDAYLYFAPTISAGTLVLKDDALGYNSFYGKILNLHTEDVVIDEDAVLEFNVTEEFKLSGGFGNSQNTPGTVRKSGAGKMTLMLDAFATFEGTIDVVGGCIANFDSNMTLNCVIKVAEGAYLDATLDDTTKVILGANAKLDLSNIAAERDKAVVKGNLKMAEGAAIVFAEDQEALLCNGALTIGEDAITETTTVTGMSIFVDGQEYIADLGIAVAEGESGAKLYTVSYSNATPIIRITTEGMDASDLNAALDEAVEGTKVLFDDEATLTLDDDVEDVDLVILGTANIDGEGTISVATIDAAGKAINLGEDVTFVPAVAPESTTTFTGSGTLVYDNITVTSGSWKNFPTAPTGLNVSTWTGTVVFKNYQDSPTGNRDFINFMNADSTVEFENVKGWFNADQNNPGTVRLTKGTSGNAALDICNGSSGFQDNKKNIFTKLVGDGKLYASWNLSFPLLIKDATDFAGSIEIANGSIGVVIGSDAAYNSPNADAGKIVVNSNASATIEAYETWTAASGVFLNGTIAGAGTLGSNTTFGNGATIDASAAQLTVAANKTLTFGNTLTVKLASAPTEDAPVKFLNGSFTEQTFDTVLTVVVNDHPAEGDFAIKQDANGVWAIANTEVVWTGAGENHNWSNPDNWQGSVVPTEGRNVVIDVGEATDYTINIDSDTAAINSLTITGAGVTFSGTGTINGPITFTTKKIAGSLKAVGDVTVSAAGAVEVTGGMDITGNLTFDNHFETLTFKDNAEVNVTGDMRTTEHSNAKVYFYDGEITVSGTLYTGADNNAYTRYYFGDADSSAMVITVNKLNADFYGRAFYNYDLASDATINVGEGGFVMQGRNDNPPLFNFAGGKYVATATSTFGGANNLRYVVNADSTIEVAGGATLTINNTVNSFGQSEKKITKTGAGTLKFSGKVLTDIDVTAGAVEMTAGDEAGVTVSEGADLYLKVTAEQKEAGYTSTATIPTGTNIYFILPDGTVVEGVGGILPPKTIAWIGVDQGSWDEPSNWSPAVVPLEDSIVSFAGEGEGTITIKISDGTRTIEGVSFNSLKNIAIDGVVNVTGAITKDGTGTLAINLGADKNNAITVSAGALEVNVSQGVTRTLSGVISGAGKLIKSGEGELKLSAANTFAGGVVINGGVVTRGAANAFGAANTVVEVKSGASLNWGDTALVGNAYRIKIAGTGAGEGKSAFYTSTNNSTLSSGSQRHPISLELTDDASIGGTYNFGIMYQNGKSYNVATVTLNGHTLTKVGSGIFYTSNLEFHNGTVVVDEGTLSVINNTNNETFQSDAKLVVGENGHLEAFRNPFTVYDVEFTAAENTITHGDKQTDYMFVVKGTVTGSFSAEKLKIAAGAKIPVTSEIVASSALTLPTEGTFAIDVTSKLTESGNFEVITGPTGFNNWDLTKVALYPTDAEGWEVGAEGNKLVVSKLPLNATVNPGLGDNFGEAVLEVNVSTIDSSMTGTKIKVVTTKDGESVEGVDPILVAIDGSKGTYEINVGNLTKGETYDFNITFVDSEDNVIEGAKVLNTSEVIANIIPGDEVFSADATGETELTKGGAWTAEQTITEGAYVIDDETPSVFDVKNAPTGNYTIEYELTFVAGFTTELTDEESAPIAGLTISKEETDETTYWYRANGTGWSKLDQAVAPGHYLIRMAFTDTTVTYSVKGDEDTNFVTLTQDTTTSEFTSGGTEEAAIQSVSFLGSSSLARFGAKTDDTIDPTIALDGDSQLIDSAEGVVTALSNGKTVTLKTNVAIDTSSLAASTYNITVGKFNLSFIGDDTRVITFANGVLKIVDETISNGQSNKVNQDLNLNPAEPTDIPFVKAINSDNPNAISFKLFHGADAKEVATDDSANANAKFFVESCDNASFKGEGVVIEKSPSAGVKETLEVPLPTGNDKVKYYRLKFNAK